MWKKRILCVMLVLCAFLMSACQGQKETFPTQARETAAPESGGEEETAVEESGGQGLFANAVVESSVDYDDGSYDPMSEEDADAETVDYDEELLSRSDGPTIAPTMQSEYAGATPVLIDPIDKPTPTPLPTLAFTFVSYEATALHLTFEAPAGWIVDDSQADAYTLTNPDVSMDYAAFLTLRQTAVNKQYDKRDLTKEIKGMLDTIRSEGYSSFSPSNTASRTFLDADGIYANYTGTTTDGVKVAGRIIACCIDKNLYTLRVSYPLGYRDFYVENVFNKLRHTIKLN